jgi:hypothetical protein
LVIEQVQAKCSAFCFFSGCCSKTEVFEQPSWPGKMSKKIAVEKNRLTGIAAGAIL